MTIPLDGIIVVDFSQFLAGPYASLKLLDMGARVIKVENPDGGDLSRQLYLSGARIGDESTLFHAINRGKESVALDLKSAEGLEAARRMVAQADVTIQNFRPGVIDRLGLGFDAVRELKPDIIYGSISGYGAAGAWADLPGQDLLAQARSGIMWLSGDAGQGPVPVGLPIADISAGANLAQGLLGALYRHARTGQGALVETSLLEGLVDLQFEFLTTWLNNGTAEPERGRKGSAHGYLPAPYGVFETAKGHLALAMTRLESLAAIPELETIAGFAGQEDAAFERKDDIHEALREAFMKNDAETWERQLAERGIWCARVLDWAEAFQPEAAIVSDMLPCRRNPLAPGRNSSARRSGLMDAGRRATKRVRCSTSTRRKSPVILAWKEQVVENQEQCFHFGRTISSIRSGILTVAHCGHKKLRFHRFACGTVARSNGMQLQ